MGWFRSTLVALAMLVGFTTLLLAGPAGAADGDPALPETGIETEETATGSVELVRDDDSSDTVQRVRRNLVAVAIVTAVGLVAFVWHTSPSHRLRIATRRADTADGQDTV